MNWDESMLWYLGRGSGLVAEVVLTLVVVLGAVSSVAGGRNPIQRRLLLQGLHRQLTLAGLVLLVVHIVTLVMDRYVDLDVLDVFVPFGSSYRTLWLGLGTLAVDALIAIVVTSLLRHRMSIRLWRGTHLLSYAAWAMAVGHGIMAGTDRTSPAVRMLAIGCAAAVAVALVYRLDAARGSRRPVAPSGTLEPRR